MFVFVCHKDKKQAIHHVLKRTCFLARFQKFKSALMQPIDNGALFRFAELFMIDGLALIFNVASVSADHSVKTDIPDFLIDFGTRASGTDINLIVPA